MVKWGGFYKTLNIYAKKLSQTDNSFYSVAK